MVTVTATTKTDSIPAIQRQYSLEIVSPDIDPALSASDAEIDQQVDGQCQSKQFADQELPSEDRELILAAAHIEDAKTGRGRYGKAKYYFKPRHAQICFKVITNQWFQRAIYITVLVHSALLFIEPPSSAPQSIHTYVAIGLNLLCLLLYLTDIILNMTFISWRIFWTLDEHSWNRLEFVLLCGFTIDWIVLIAAAATGNRSVVPPFRSLRLAMIMCKAKNVGHIYNVVKSITIKLGGIMLVVLLFILLYSCIGVHLVMDPYRDIDSFVSGLPTPVVDTNVSNSSLSFCTTSKEQGRYRIYQGTFDHIGKGAIQLFVLLTTENYPVFMFPAFLVSKFYFVYFGTFLFFGVFFLTAILLAITANLYWKYNKKHVKKERLRQRAELVKAWKLLDICDQEKLQVDDPKFLKLFRILNPKNTDEENMELIYELDPECSGYINWIQWVTQLLSILDLEKTSSQEHRHTKRQHDTHCPITRKLARKVTGWPHFEKVVLLLIVLHSVLFALKWHSMEFAAEITVQALRTAIVTMFMVEMLVRFCAIGKGFFTNYLDAVDFLLVTVGFVSNVVWYGSLVPGVRTSVYLWRGGSVVVSCLAIFCRLFFNSAQSRRVMLAFVRLFPVMYDLIVLFAIILYWYAAIGMEAFHRFDIQPDAPNSDHFLYGCGLGFNNFKCSLFIMFQVATTSNWHEIMNSVVLNVGNYAPVIYFISCYTVMILVIMNLLIAIGIEAFNKFSESEQGHGSKQDTGPSEAPVLEENYGSIEDQSDSVPHPSHSNIFQILAKVANVAFSSIRENSMQDEEMGFENTTPSRDSLSGPYGTASDSGDDSSPSGTLHVEEYSTTRHVITRKASVYDLPVVKEETEPEEETREERGRETERDSNDVFYSEAATSSATRRRAEQKVGDMGEKKLQSRYSREKLQKKLIEKHKQKRLQRQQLILTSGSSIDEEDSHTEEPPERNTESVALFQRKGTPLNQERPRNTFGWRPATNAIKFINSAARKMHHNQVSPQATSDKLHPDSTDQDIDCPNYLKQRKNSGVNSKRFRRGFNPNNWRSQVQNLTIINKEEISQLRKELCQRRSPIRGGRRRFHEAETMLNLPLPESEEDALQDTKVKVEQRRCSSPTLQRFNRTKRKRSSSLSTHEFIDSESYLHHKRDSISSDSTNERPHRSSLTENELSQTQTRRGSLQTLCSSADEDSKHGQDTPSSKRMIFKTPTISVDEAPEETSSSASTPPVDPTGNKFNLKVPKLRKESKGMQVFTRNTKSGHSGEAPEWAIRLTRQYNILLQCHLSSESSDNLPTPA